MKNILYIFYGLLLSLLVNGSNINISNLKTEELKVFLKENENVGVGFFNSTEDNILQRFDKISDSLKDQNITFVYTTDLSSLPWVSNKINVRIDTPGIVFFKNDNGYPFPITEPTNNKFDFKLRQFAVKCTNPYVSDLTFDNYMQYIQGGGDFLIYFNENKEDKENKADLMKELALNHFDKYNVVYADIKSNPLNINSEEYIKKFIIVSSNFMSFYRQSDVLGEDDEINYINIDYFIRAYESVIIPPQILWRQDEMNWDFTNYVTEIRLNTYDSVVLSKEKDVLVVYYKKDCPYSIPLLETLQELAQRFINLRDKLTIAQFEAENQTIPKSSPWRHLEAYPTIVLYPASKNGQIKRQFYVKGDGSGRSAINIARWMLKRANNEYPEISYNAEDFKKLNEIDGGYLNEDSKDEEEERKINEYLANPDLIFTKYGEGIDQVFYTADSENQEYYVPDQMNGELPLTSKYFELTPTTYIVHYPMATNSPKEIARQRVINERKQIREQNRPK